jgi:hypothetical protein
LSDDRDNIFVGRTCHLERSERSRQGSRSTYV